MTALPWGLYVLGPAETPPPQPEPTWRFALRQEAQLTQAQFRQLGFATLLVPPEEDL